MISYAIVWVSPDRPDIMLDTYSDGYTCLDEAQDAYKHILAFPNDDGLDWIPRITKITEEFV